MFLSVLQLVSNKTSGLVYIWASASSLYSIYQGEGLNAPPCYGAQVNGTGQSLLATRSPGNANPRLIAIRLIVPL